MGTFRGVVLPVLRLCVWAVIALALVYMAFTRGGTSGDLAAGPLEPYADTSSSVVPVTTADLASTIEVTGTVAADPAATVKSTAAGTVSKVHVAVGAAVQATSPLFDVKVTLDPVPGKTVTAADGTVTTTPETTRTRTVTVTAGSAGVVATLDVLKDQDVAVGTAVATVSPGTLSVKAPLTQAQQFRLLTPPAAASAQAPGGPAPFECTDLRTAAAATSGSTSGQPGMDPMTGMPIEASTAEVTCRVPAGTTVFAGMSVNLTIDTGSVAGALAVPLTAVLGSVESGTVWAVGPDGQPTERAVKLGINDGEQVQVIEGLAEGDEVLQFAPVPGAAPSGGKPGEGG